MKRILIFLAFVFTSISVFGQTQANLPPGSTPFGNQYWKDPDGNVWFGGGFNNYTNLGNWERVADSLGARVPTSRTLDMNPGAGITVSPSTAQNLTANRSWNFGIDETYLNTLYIPLSQKAAINGVASLDANGHVPSSQLPPLAIGEVFVENSQAAMLGLTAQIGDVCVRTDESKSYILQAEPASTLANWVELLNPGAPVQSVNGQTGSVDLDLSFAGGQLSLTGDGSVDMNAWGDNRFYPLNSNPAGYLTSGDIPASQTLAFANNADLAITDGNTVKIDRIYNNIVTNGNDPVTIPAAISAETLHPIVWTASETGWPYSAGGGIRSLRTTTASNTVAGFDIFRQFAGSETGIQYREKLSGDLTSWSPVRTFASREWVNTQIPAPQDLQAVTTIGNTTTDPIKIGSALDSTYALTGENLGFGLSWNQDSVAVDWGETGIINVGPGQDIITHTVPFGDNQVFYLGNLDSWATGSEPGVLTFQGFNAFHGDFDIMEIGRVDGRRVSHQLQGVSGGGGQVGHQLLAQSDDNTSSAAVNISTVGNGTIGFQAFGNIRLKYGNQSDATDPAYIIDQNGLRAGDDYSGLNASNPEWIPDKRYVDAKLQVAVLPGTYNTGTLNPGDVYTQDFTVSDVTISDAVVLMTPHPAGGSLIHSAAITGTNTVTVTTHHVGASGSGTAQYSGPVNTMIIRP